MSLYVLTVLNQTVKTGTVEWYFWQHSHFLRARKHALDNGLYVTERIDFETDLDDYLEWATDYLSELKGGVWVRGSASKAS